MCTYTCKCVMYQIKCLSYFSESRLINGKIHTNIRIVTLENHENGKRKRMNTWGQLGVKIIKNVRITINAITMTPPNQP